MNWQTFSELAFSFTLTGEIIYKAILFSALMGFIGGFLPGLPCVQDEHRRCPENALAVCHKNIPTAGQS